MSGSTSLRANTIAHELPPHLAGWQLPPGWRWGGEGVNGEHRHTQEVVDALGRSLALVSAPDPAHAGWLEAEARFLAHRSSHPSIPTTYHYWTLTREVRRGPGYLRRWIVGETIGQRVRRAGPADIPYAMQMLRAVGSALAYLHDTGSTHGALSGETVGITPTGRQWLLGWQWAVPATDIPEALRPDPRWIPQPPEWHERWTPTPASDQWLLGALVFLALTGEAPPPSDVPPIRWLRRELPQGASAVLDRALQPDPAQRHGSVAALLRALERVATTNKATLVVPDLGSDVRPVFEDDQSKLRWAVGDDYEVLAKLGTGTFGSVWRVRDLALEREVALKMLHPRVAVDDVAVARFQREARLAAQLAHPSIVPIYDWDNRGEVAWYTMELAEGGSVESLMTRSGPRSLAEISGPIDAVLDGLNAAHASGIIHRDLKPENLLIDRYRRWRISDFGIANETGAELGGPSGTPAFAAPEQLLGESQSSAVDTFSVAAIVAYLLTGRPPFGDDDVERILGRMLTGTLDLAPYPEEIREWLRKGLATDPEARFVDAAAMRSAWRAAYRKAAANGTRRPWWKRLVSDQATHHSSGSYPAITPVPRRSQGL